MCAKLIDSGPGAALPCSTAQPELGGANSHVTAEQTGIGGVATLVTKMTVIKRGLLCELNDLIPDKGKDFIGSCIRGGRG
jgi:hypothetical protein